MLEQHRKTPPPSQPPQSDPNEPGRIERLLVRWGVWLVPIFVAWITDSIDKGLELAKLLASVAAR